MTDGGPKAALCGPQCRDNSAITCRKCKGPGPEFCDRTFWPSMPGPENGLVSASASPGRPDRAGAAGPVIAIRAVGRTPAVAGHLRAADPPLCLRRALAEAGRVDFAGGQEWNAGPARDVGARLSAPGHPEPVAQAPAVLRPKPVTRPEMGDFPEAERQSAFLRGHF